MVIDIVVQFDRDERGRFISEIVYAPRRERSAGIDGLVRLKATAP